MMMIFLSRDATRSVAYTPWRGVRLCVCVCVCVSGCSYFVRKGVDRIRGMLKLEIPYPLKN